MALLWEDVLPCSDIMIQRQRVFIDIGTGKRPLLLKRKVSPKDKWILIDKNKEHLLEAKQVIKQRKPAASVSYIQANLDREIWPKHQDITLPIKNGSANHVDCRMMYHGGRLPDPDLLVNEIKRILKTKGTTTISVRESNPEKWIEEFEKRGFKLISKSRRAKTNYERFERKRERWLQDHNLSQAKYLESIGAKDGAAIHRQKSIEKQFYVFTFKRID